MRCSQMAVARNKYCGEQAHEQNWCGTVVELLLCSFCSRGTPNPRPSASPPGVEHVRKQFSWLFLVDCLAGCSARGHVIWSGWLFCDPLRLRLATIQKTLFSGGILFSCL